MARKGLGKGLDSLIPDIYNENFDSNSGISLDDMLGDGDIEIPAQDETPEKETSEDTVKTTEESSEENVETPEEETSQSEDAPEEVDDAGEEDSSKAEDAPEEVDDAGEEDLSKAEDASEEEDVEVIEEITEDLPADDETSTEEDESEEISTEEIDQSGEVIEESEEVEKEEETFDYNPEHVEEVKKIVDKNPRITLWSARSSAVFRYLRKTEPEFSISKEASKLIEEAVSKKYPEIWDLFDEDDD